MLVPFISEKLAIAPYHPPEKFPNLLLREVMLDRRSFFQVWSPKAGAVLLPMEANLLLSDRSQVEAICTRLVWLLGATCSEQENHLLTNQKFIHYWEDVVYFASKYKFRPNVIDVLFSNQTIRSLSTSKSNSQTQWAMEPACWEIFFLQLKPFGDGFLVEPRHQYLSVIIWTGQPVIKGNR